MTESIEAFFERYAEAFRQGLAGKADLDEIASLYAAEFLAASPQGVFTGRNDESLKTVMQQGYANYAATGMQAMRFVDVEATPIDDLHSLAKVRWSSDYVRKDGSPVTIDFEVAYLVRTENGERKVFAWIVGDEQALLRERGVTT